jgi:hypothetical protein
MASLSVGYVAWSMNAAHSACSGLWLCAVRSTLCSGVSILRILAFALARVR